MIIAQFWSKDGAPIDSDVRKMWRRECASLTEHRQLQGAMIASSWQAAWNGPDFFRLDALALLTPHATGNDVGFKAIDYSFDQRFESLRFPGTP